MSATPFVIVTRKLPEPVEVRMRELFDAQLNLTDSPMDRDALVEAVRRADVLAPTVTDRIDAAILDQAGPQLKLIANFGAGVDHIDLDACARRGIVVTNTPGVLTDDTADMTMALILAVSRRLVEGAQLLLDGGFKGWAPTGMLGHRIGGKALGIVGMGRIGQAVARRAGAFGMHIHYHNRRPLSPLIAGPLEATFWADLDSMLARCDVIVLTCPSTPQTHHLISRERLARLQPHALLINTSRGDVIDEAALADALESGQLAGAGLDVYEREPVVHPGLLGLSNVVLLPHMGSGTIEARNEMGEKVIVNIRTFLDGHRPPDRVIIEPKAS